MEVARNSEHREVEKTKKFLEVPNLMESVYFDTNNKRERDVSAEKNFEIREEEKNDSNNEVNHDFEIIDNFGDQKKKINSKKFEESPLKKTLSKNKTTSQIRPNTLTSSRIGKDPKLETTGKNKYII